MLILYILAIMWMLGTAAFFVGLIFGSDVGFSVIERVWGCLIAIPIWAVIGIAPLILLYDRHHSPDLVTLKRDSWECKASHTKDTTTMVMNGNVLVPITTSVQVCDLYGRK